MSPDFSKNTSKTQKQKTTLKKSTPAFYFINYPKLWAWFVAKPQYRPFYKDPKIKPMLQFPTTPPEAGGRREQFPSNYQLTQKNAERFS